MGLCIGVLKILSKYLTVWLDLVENTINKELHNRINHIIKRALGSADLNARTEPYTANLSSAEGAIGLVPDGVTLQTFKHGKALIWDFTCHNTFAPSYLRTLPIEEGSVAKKAEDDKDWKYRFMTNEFHFIPICVETMGVWGPKGYKFIKEFGKLISDKTMERRSTSFLRQSTSRWKYKGETVPVFWVQ
jgi:hypothetical protein